MELGKRIKAYRKQLGLTQENLAEKMGVSVGAVSKWEAETNCPELPLLLRLAQTFQVSLDALTGFALDNQHRETCLKRLKDLTRHKQYEQGQAEVEEILCSYPQDFHILFEAARFYHLAGIEQDRQTDLERSVFLYRKAIPFLQQNSNPHITREVLENIIAKLLIALGEYEEALQILRKNNANNINDFLIAETQVKHLKQSEQALPLLSQELYLLLSKLLQVSLTLAQAYYQLGRLEEGLDILQRCWPLLASFQQADRVSMFDKVQVIYKSYEAAILHGLRQINQAREALELAKSAALRFDQEPNFQLQGFPHFYLEENYLVYDDFGQNTLDGISEVLRSLPSPGLLDLWETIKEEGNNAQAVSGEL
ncbi:MAG: helix-turn-helix transcriptional regulator [Eubacteriales bacterium]|nr:helix-turn-helix transcriptional regulator [Eubacteriales bacterium]